MFSVPEIDDLRQRVKSLSAIGDFSTIGFTLIGLGEPREVRAGVVGGTYFDVMGLHPVLGRLLDMRDDGPSAAGAMVLTYRFWTTALKSAEPTTLYSTSPPRRERRITSRSLDTDASSAFTSRLASAKALSLDRAVMRPCASTAMSRMSATL